MINGSYIVQWSAEHPWVKDSYVEQDLVISRALVSIYSDAFLAENLAFRGGTAIHKLYLSPQLRYSEDIDLVQIKPGPIKPIVERLDKVMSWLPNKSFEARRFGFRQKFRFQSEGLPYEPLRLKIEVNTFEHYSELGYVEMPFAVTNPWFTGAGKLTTYSINELFGSKLRAIYQRKKGRDLFDMNLALEHNLLETDSVIRCWRRFMLASCNHIPTAKEFILNMEAKLNDQSYRSDTLEILRPGTSFDPDTAWRTLREKVIKYI